MASSENHWYGEVLGRSVGNMVRIDQWMPEGMECKASLSGS